MLCQHWENELAESLEKSTAIYQVSAYKAKGSLHTNKEVWHTGHANFKPIKSSLSLDSLTEEGKGGPGLYKNYIFKVDSYACIWVVRFWPCQVLFPQ